MEPKSCKMVKNKSQHYPKTILNEYTGEEGVLEIEIKMIWTHFNIIYVEDFESFDQY